MQSVIGLTVFSGILVTIVYGTGILQGDAESRQAEKPASTPAERLAFAQTRGDWQGVESACRELISLDAFDSRAIFNLGYSLHRQQRLNEAAEQYRIARDYLEFRPWSLYNLACIEALQHRPDEALVHLDKVISEGFVSQGGINADPDFGSLKDDPEFQRLVLVESINRQERDAGQ